MFEGIRHNSSCDGITTAHYNAGGVWGWVSFRASHNRSAVSSNVGPDDAFRECYASHFYSRFSGRFIARVVEEINDYSQQENSNVG